MTVRRIPPPPPGMRARLHHCTHCLVDWVGGRMCWCCGEGRGVYPGQVPPPPTNTVSFARTTFDVICGPALDTHPPGEVLGLSL